MRGGEHVEPRRDADERVGPRRGAGRQHGRGIRQGTSRTIGPATFCHEAQLVAQAEGITSFSNAPVAGNHSLADLRVGQAHTIVDMGADEFTLGRPHPMIDPTLRDEATYLVNHADNAGSTPVVDHPDEG